MMRKRKRLWAMLLSAALIATQMPAAAMAENITPQDKGNFTAGEREDGLDHKSIASFAKLPSGVAKQNVTVGTELSKLNLPDEVTAKVYHVTEDKVIPGEVNDDDFSTATPSDAEDSVSGSGGGDPSNMDSGKTVTTATTDTVKIPVTWDSAPAYNGGTAGRYVFTADVGSYVLADGVKAPQITVTVEEETKSCTKTPGCTLADGHEGECVTAPRPTACL